MANRFWILALVAVAFYAIGARHPGIYQQAMKAVTGG